ncbi:MAG: hypothetical protein E6J01_03850 [Chloroflexi bacterium]|nr:MAG: hypothetical protein E6J01_03850 [Chloroflexota bacterium]
MLQDMLLPTDTRVTTIRDPLLLYHNPEEWSRREVARLMTPWRRFLRRLPFTAGRRESIMNAEIAARIGEKAHAKLPPVIRRITYGRKPEE